MKNEAISHEKPPTEDEIRAFLKLHKVTQKQASVCGGIALRTMQYYATGKRTMSTPLWLYMRRNILERLILVSRGELKAI